MLRPRIVTITGASGAGKTTVAGGLLEAVPKAKMIVSYTTRSPRPNDLPGEYKYNITTREFETRKDRFLWVIPEHDNLYGTLASSIFCAATTVGPNIAIFVPNVMKQLRTYLFRGGLENRLISFYILSPGEEELRRRLLIKRNTSEAETQRRIDDCKKWDQEACELNIPYIFLENNEPEMGIQKAVTEILKHL